MDLASVGDKTRRSGSLRPSVSRASRHRPPETQTADGGENARRCSEGLGGPPALGLLGRRRRLGFNRGVSRGLAWRGRFYDGAAVVRLRLRLLAGAVAGYDGCGQAQKLLVAVIVL